jgi:coenzyme PQQ precursor peptide PqqA
MKWTTPSFVEIRMDAEVGSYQADDEPEPAFVEASDEPADASASA